MPASRSERFFQSPAIPKPLEIGGDGGIELRSFLLLLTQGLREPFHLLVERLVVVLNIRRTNVASRRQDVVVLSDLIDRRGHAEACDVGILADVFVSSPR